MRQYLMKAPVRLFLLMVLFAMIAMRTLQFEVLKKGHPHTHSPVLRKTATPFSS